jgi:dihydrodipicolinate synthase/N-acetylneuraminate lyase
MATAVPHWEGVFPVLCTPFDEEGAVDTEAQRAVVRFALACGAHGLVCFGLGGEVNKLTPDERRRLAEAIVDEAGETVPVLVGVGAEAVHTAIGLARHAETAGAAGVVIPPPFTSALGSEELVAYFAAVADAVTLPVMIQDASVYLGARLAPMLVGRLASERPNIRYVKIEAGPDETARWAAELPPNVGIFTGDAGVHLLSTLRAGAAGSIPAVDVCDRLVAVYEAETAGDADGADALHRRLLPYLVFALQGGIDHVNACTKEVLVHRGVLAHGGLRPPAPERPPLFSELVAAHVAELAAVV